MIDYVFNYLKHGGFGYDEVNASVFSDVYGGKRRRAMLIWWRRDLVALMGRVI